MKQSRDIWIGSSRIISNDADPAGGFVEIEGERFYRISNYRAMPDFFISIVSDSDHWMFISSNGSLTAGRKNRNNTLFPYYTDDKIHDYRGKTGSKTYFLVEKDYKRFLWEPFTDESGKFYRITTNLYKSIYGNKIIFEEINLDLGLSFRYSWNNSERFGFVKKSYLENIGENPVQVEVLDGLQNILPSGVDFGFQNELSNLLDAYKKNELVKGTSLGLFTLSSIPVDKAEPSESLKATVVWSAGLREQSNILLSQKQITKFVSVQTVEEEHDVRASRGAYFIQSTLELTVNESREWMTVAEINCDSADVVNLKRFIKTAENPVSLVNEDIQRGTENLKRLVSGADGLQKTNSENASVRHYMNTLFNIMRGGTFAGNYLVDPADFIKYIEKINKEVYRKFEVQLKQVPAGVSIFELQKMARETGDTNFIRITGEYLPLVFSRRHGDPSRPWNHFSIETKNEDGSPKYNYEGNWRDIFQNWESLSLAFPEFIESFISRFVNGSTADGYNPYRIMRNGIDWETPDPEDPWAYIGYWGDHQVIYLQKLLELSENFHPGKLDKLLTQEIFTYANVPYRIKPWEEILKNPKDTVVFDHTLNRRIGEETFILGADARLLKDKKGDKIYKVNLAEKILVTWLSKLSNFIPEAGIWMNTQRPEWNDANNALVGNGASMVTLYYLRRFLVFWLEKFNRVAIDEVKISKEVALMFRQMSGFLEKNTGLLQTGFSPTERKSFAEFLGKAHSNYRLEIYNNGFSGENTGIGIKDLEVFTKLCLRYIDHSIKANKREDGLYHAYNLISIKPDGIYIRHLYEMLEGQVAVLSSGLLSPEEGLAVLDVLKQSKIYRPDQYSYMLYPDRYLPRFIEKNNIPAEVVNQSPLLNQLLEQKDKSVIVKDEEGHFHFHSSFRNADVLEIALNSLKQGGHSQLVETEKEKILDLYEEVFDHQSFTGRSGTMYGYEGLGSIYWHMVSKLLLALQENFFTAVAGNASQQVISGLRDHYYEIKAGIGIYKEPSLYGAFPIDAYSHTPGMAGVKQPGLTGQVKEDVISRMAELGVRVKNGALSFDLSLLHHEETLVRPDAFGFYDLIGNFRKIDLKQGQLAFTFCQVPVIYTKAGQDKIEVIFTNGDLKTISGNSLDVNLSAEIFNRTGNIKQIGFYFKPRNPSA
ncbi:MAG: hypothetical protein JW731_14550 [Bacteroidales bacterium]|nr:hypothetical protein [Bacteroidales bacterium]